MTWGKSLPMVYHFKMVQWYCTRFNLLTGWYRRPDLLDRGKPGARTPLAEWVSSWREEILVSLVLTENAPKPQSLAAYKMSLTSSGHWILALCALLVPHNRTSPNFAYALLTIGW